MKKGLLRNGKKRSGLTTAMSANIRRRNDPVFARKFVTVGVIVSVIMVALSLFVTFYYNPERVARRKLAELATTYYESYYHDKFMETIDPELKEEKMKLYEQTGFQPVLLRQLLLYQNGKYSDYKQYFEGDGLSCDKNTTSAKFYPVYPYGVKDYTVEYNLVCDYE